MNSNEHFNYGRLETITCKHCHNGLECRWLLWARPVRSKSCICRSVFSFTGFLHPYTHFYRHYNSRLHLSIENVLVYWFRFVSCPNWEASKPLHEEGFALGRGIDGEVVWSHLIVQLSIATFCQLVYRTNLNSTYLPPTRARTHARVEAVNDRDSCQMKRGRCVICRERVIRRTFLHVSYLEFTGRTFLCVE
jgi:hypothetical protein